MACRELNSMGGDWGDLPGPLPCELVLADPWLVPWAGNIEG